MNRQNKMMAAVESLLLIFKGKRQKAGGKRTIYFPPTPLLPASLSFIIYGISYAINR
jgi:hypothetical protein